MDDKYLPTLEYPRIIEQLVTHTSFSACSDLALSLRPSADVALVRRRIQETTEAKALLATHTGVTVGGAHDVRPLVRHAALWATLQPSELLAIRSTLISVRSLHRLLARLADEYPLLSAKATEMQPLAHIIDDIDRCLDDEGRILDSASPTLAGIRRESAVARERLLDRLRRIVTSSENARFLQEPIVTERNRRYVIPLKIEFKGRIPGIIHDQSSSGATLFIEPLATVELNNRWHELQLEEQREIERILAQLSRAVGQEADVIEKNVTVLAELDLALAKARYSFALRAVPAEICSDQWPVAEPGTELPPEKHPFQLIRARHPLLPRDSVVPIDVYIGGDYTVLLVTGPNTGGKTVTLKTVGLLAAMSQAGLHIPAGDGSRLPVFTGIYADIGDEQSIEQSLSTFSSHMSHIVDVLNKADSGSLVLLDELGAGTDPVEGAALAQVLMTTLIERNCLALCSSHYSRLKVYAFNTPGVQNGSVEFDVQTLSPTYHLSIGLPGRSYALPIAEQLGLAPEIIVRARHLIAPEELQADTLLASLKVANEAAERARDETEGRQARVRELEYELRKKLASIEETRRQVLNQARAEGRQALGRLRAEIRRLRLGLGSSNSIQVAQEVSDAIDQLAEEMAPLEPLIEPSRPSTEKLRVGDTVYVTTLGQTGELVRCDEQEAEVRAGGFRLRTRLDSLEFRSRPKPTTPTEESSVQRPQVVSPGMELDLRGFRAEEVAPTLDKYLDNAYLAGLPWVHIIHGKGTGVLKSVVRQYLSSHPLVESYRPGELSEGGDGNTVVRLQKFQD